MTMLTSGCITITETIQTCDVNIIRAHRLDTPGTKRQILAQECKIINLRGDELPAYCKK